MYTAFTSVLCIKLICYNKISIFFRKSQRRLCRSAWVCSSSRRWNTSWRWGCPWSTCPCVGRGGSWDWCVCWSRDCRCDTWRATSRCAHTCATWGRRASGTTWSTAGTCAASPENTNWKENVRKCLKYVNYIYEIISDFCAKFLMFSILNLFFKRNI